MKTLASIAAMTALVFASTAAQALTMSNLDDRAYKLQIVEGGNTKSIEIGPKARLEGLCAARCQVTVDGDPDPYELESNDVVQLEEGQLYFEDNTAGAEGDTSQ